MAIKHLLPGIVFWGVMTLSGCTGSSQKKGTSASDTDSIPSQELTTLPSDTISTLLYPENISNQPTADLVKGFLQNRFKEDLSRDLIPSESRNFVFYTYDLNKDGKDEIFVGLTGPYFCGSGGCTVFLLNSSGAQINRFTVVEYPVLIAAEKTDGWDNLIMMSNQQYHLLKFNGKNYPSNPSVEPVLQLLPGENLPKALNFFEESYPKFSF